MALSSSEPEQQQQQQQQHDWEYSKENAAPLECGRSAKSLSKLRAFGTSTAVMAEVEEKTKKYEKLVKRSEKAVEWMQRQSKRLIEKDGSAPGRDLSEDEAQSLRDKLAIELRFDPSTSNREHVDYDPMRYWVLYIKHIRESYPSDSQKQFLLMERCARTFMYARPFLVPPYKNDLRFVRTCILYADKTSEPIEVFKLMSKLKVGYKVSLFWVAWAWVTEKAQDFRFTEKIFQKGLSVDAEPRKQLETRQRQFLRRMSRHWLNASQAQEDGIAGEGGGDEEEEEGRGALTSLSSTGVARNDRGGAFNRHAQRQQRENGSSSRQSSRSGDQQQQQQQQGRAGNKPAVGFNIFQEEDRSSSSPDVLNDNESVPIVGQRLAKESERTKENNMRPERWNERGHGLVHPSSAALPPAGADSIRGTVGREPDIAANRTIVRSNSGAAFDVFVDEEFTTEDNDDAKDASSAEKVVDQRSLRQRLDGGAAERLTRDPLRYMKNPSKIESDHLKYDARPEIADAAALKREERMKPGDDGRAQKPPLIESKTVSGGFDKRLLKDSSGQECCFEEQRMSAQNYKLISPDANFNLLKQEVMDTHNSSQMDVSVSMIVEESMEEMDESMEAEEEVAATTMPAMKSVLKSSLRQRGIFRKINENEVAATAAENPRRVLFGANTNVVYTNVDTSVNTSTCSSQLNGSFVKDKEETINTKLANAEISMMFSSPGANASLAETPGKSLFDERPLFSVSDKNSDAAGSSFAIHDENKPEPGGLNFSIYQEDDENEKGTKDGKDCAVSNGLSFAIHDENKPEPGGLNFSIFQEDENDKSSSDAKGHIASNSNGFAIHDENKESGGLKFSIFQEDSNEKSDESHSTSNGPTFAIHDENEEAAGGLNFAIYQEDNDEKSFEKKDTKDSMGPGGFAIHDESEQISGPTGFSIFQDDNEKSVEKKSTKDSIGRVGFAIHDESKQISGHAGFSIFQDDTPQRLSSGSSGDTASLSVIGNIIGGIGTTSAEHNPRKEESAPVGFGMYADPEPSSKPPRMKSSRNDIGRSTRQSRRMRDTKKEESVSEDTASLSIIGDVMGSLQSCSVTEPPAKPSSGFAIYSDENAAEPPIKDPEGFKIFTDVSSPPKSKPFEIFSDEAKESAQKKRKVVSNSEPCFGDISRIEDEKTSNFQIMDENESSTSAINYTSRHSEDIESAMRQCIGAAAKSRSRYAIFDLRKKSMPRALLRKSFSSGTKIDLYGGGTVTIVNELGRGVYGVVLLCTDENGQSDALKIQAPIGSLAHEYSLLLKIEGRVQADATGFYPFPRSRALYAFSEGGLFSMTAGSNSGMTLIDVVNTFKAKIGNVPELIAIYYTSRMLKHLESLHLDGKVLHADIKPDNWVLTSSPKDQDHAGTDAVGGADLMLVDFGRSIDLEKVKSRGLNPLHTQFEGNIAAEDMECVNMRKGLPWGVDLDFFGLAASSYILLFGSHIKVEEKRTGKWGLSKGLRRYWQCALWDELFGILLNFDSSSDNYCLSDIRVSFDEYIDGKQRKFEIASYLNQLYTHLPKKR